MCSSILKKMGLQRKVVISLEESFQRILPSDIDMEISLVHESSLLDELRKEVREPSLISLRNLLRGFMIALV